MNVEAYLDRIGYLGPHTPNRETLRSLHRAHMLAVPFENLSIHSGEYIRLDLEWLYDKIVVRRRGGFCYELNGLFAWLLREVGFRVTLLSARVRNAEGTGFGPEFDHMLLKIDLDVPYLADVGFGHSFLEPLRLQTGLEQRDPAGSFRIIQTSNGLELQEQEPSGWLPQHRFTLTPRQLADYQPMCHYHQTSLKSPFPRKWMASIARPAGRTTLTAKHRLEIRNGLRQEFPYSPEELPSLLKELFGIEGVQLN